MLFQKEILSENAPEPAGSQENGRSGQQVHQQYSRIFHGQAACAALNSGTREPEGCLRAAQLRIRHVQGHIEVAAGMSTILYFLPKYVEAFRRAHPRIEIRLQQVTGLEGLERLRTGLVDFAVGPLMQVPTDIEFHPIVYYDAVVITCLGHPLVCKETLTLEDISRYPLILPPRNLSTWPMVDSTFKKHGLSYEVAMEVGGWEAIKKYVELGLGISIIISIGITGQERLEVIPAGEFFPKRAYGVVLRKGRILTPQAKRFVSLLLSASERPVSSIRNGGGTKPVDAGPKTSA